MKNNFQQIVIILLASAIYVEISATASLIDPNNMLAFVKSFLPESPIILEAGGNVGEDTQRMKNVWPNSTMHVFEPLPSSFELMKKNTKHLKNVFCYPYALTTYTGRTSFYVDIPNNAASSINYPVEWNKDEFDKTPIHVPCITLNNWVNTNKISHIDFMWLDMEGHELYALQHASDILSTVKAIYTEISFEPIRENSCSYIDLKAFLEQHGFYEHWKSSDSGRFGDALFIRK